MIFNGILYVYIFITGIWFLCPRKLCTAEAILLCFHCVPSPVLLSRCPVPTWTRPQHGWVHYTHAVTETSN